MKYQYRLFLLGHEHSLVPGQSDIIGKLITGWRYKFFLDVLNPIVSIITIALLVPGFIDVYGILENAKVSGLPGML